MTSMSYVGVTLSLCVVGCSAQPPTERVDVQTSVADRLCVAQLLPTGLDQVEVVRLDGRHHLRRLTVSDRSSMPSWGRLSPDGAYLAGIQSGDYPRPNRFVGLHLDGHSAWNVERVISSLPAISADASRIAFATNGRLTLYTVSTGEFSELGVNGQNPSWAPDGRRLAYDDGGTVHILDVTTGAQSRVGRGTQPSWAPDGTHVSVRSSPTTVDLIEVETRERRRLLDADAVTVPRWSPDGQWMLYTKAEDVPWWAIMRGATEPHEIIVRDTRSGAETVIGRFAKANPADYQWVENADLCESDAPIH